MNDVPFTEKAQYYDMLYHDKNYEAEIKYIKPFLRPNGLIADFGCGTGEHLNTLSRNYQCVGFDLSPEMIAIARSKYPELDFKVADICLIRGNCFSTIISLFHVINYQRSLEALKEFFDTCFLNLISDGIVLFDFWNKAGVDLDPPKSRTKERNLNGTYLRRTSHPSKLWDGTYSIRFNIEMQTPTAPVICAEEVHLMKPFSQCEIRDAALSAGFKTIEFYEWMTDKKLIDQWYGFCVCQK